MYLPKHFSETDLDKICQLIQDHAFATLISMKDGKPFVNHLPILLQREGSQLRLRGHMARANPQWLQFTSPVMVIIHGPHAYISPKLYLSPGVPTWNYVTIHLTGKAKVLEDEGDVKQIIETLTEQYEQGPNPWKVEYPERLLQVIVGFEIEIKDIQAKFKLSQNRPVEDRQNIVQQLPDEQTMVALKKLMRENT